MGKETICTMESSPQSIQLQSTLQMLRLMDRLVTARI